MKLPSRDFESLASAISPHQHNLVFRLLNCKAYLKSFVSFYKHSDILAYFFFFFNLYYHFSSYFFNLQMNPL